MNLRQFTMLTLSLLNTEILLGQITGNINTTDPKAQLISVEHRAALCGKEWRCLGLVEIRRGVRDEFEKYGTVEFSSDGQFKCSFNKDGKWTIINEQFLKISISTNTNSKPLLNGAYSIYALSDSALVLGQILTSSGDWTREYTFTSSSTLSKSRRHAMVYEYPDDSLQEGKRIKHYGNGQVSSIEQFHLVKKKISAEELFLYDYKVPLDRYNAADSTMLVSVRNGEWIYYYPDGKVQAKYYYNDEGEPIGRWVRFLSDGRLNVAETYNLGQWEFSDRYQYRRGEIWPIIKREARNSEPAFVIGSKDSVQFNQIDFHETGQADSYLEKKIGVRNLSAHNITVVIPANPLFDIKSTQVEINPNDLAVLNLRIRIPTGVTDDQIQVRTTEWRFGLSFHFFGYHLTNADFDSNVRRTLPSKLFFHRASDDYELEIVSSTKDKFFAISKQMNMIELKKGTYQFTLIGPSGRKTIDVEIH